MFIKPGWQRQAKCKLLSAVESDKLFFLGKGQRSTKAKAYCKDCPVRKSCLLYAAVYDEEGIWAGTTKDERKSLSPKLVARVKQELIDSGYWEERSAPELEVKQVVEASVSSTETSEVRASVIVDGLVDSSLVKRLLDFADDLLDSFTNAKSADQVIISSVAA